MQDDKSGFIKTRMFLLLNELHSTTTARWGKMDAQQMIEHVADFFDVSTEKIKFDLVTPEEHLPKYKEFLLSEKQFRENTKAPTAVLGEEPLPLRTASLDKAIEKLKTAVADFFEYFKNDPAKTTIHPVFGPLNFEEWILMHYKHVTHHWRQFGIATE